VPSIRARRTERKLPAASLPSEQRLAAEPPVPFCRQAAVPTAESASGPTNRRPFSSRTSAPLLPAPAVRSSWLRLWAETNSLRHS
jgi:hypothetical protein